LKVINFKRAEMDMVFDKRTRKRMARKAGWTSASSAAAFLAGTAVYKILEAGWRAKTHRDPPTQIDKRGGGWGRALAWTAGTAAAVSVAGFVAEHGTRKGLERATGKKAPA
jgi:hypothetical protein